MRVYLDNCTTTKVADEITDTMLPSFKEEYGHPICSIGQEANETVEQARTVIAGTINAKADDLVFTS